jgi:glycosyltransferase involved in cell wall biosynthesis
VTAVSRDLAAKVQTHLQLHIDDAHVHAMPAAAGERTWTIGGGGLITVARLIPQKRVELAIEALAHIRAVGQEVTLTIVGDGPDRARLEQVAHSQGVTDAVTFVGAVAPDQVSKYLATADVMLFPAAHEGFGLVAAEALMSGVAVVACWDGGGVLDIVPEKGAGRLVIPRPEAIADATIDLLNDRARAASARAEGERWRSKLAPDTVAARCLTWYREACDHVEAFGG